MHATKKMCPKLSTRHPKFLFHPPCMVHIIQVITSIYRLVPGPGTTYDGVGGWGGMLTFM